MIKRAFLALCLFPGCVLGGSTGASGAIEEGKAFGKSANAAMPNASELQPEAVPGFETATPPAASYYGKPSALGDAGAAAASDNEAAQSVTEGFATRPMFTIDRSTDPMFERMGQVEAGAASIAGAMQGEYSSCQPVVVETPYPPTKESCYENRQTESRSCSRKLMVTCDPETDGCDAGGLVPGSWDGDMKVALIPSSNGDFIFQFGTIADNYWSGYGAIFDRTLMFEIVNVELISKFALTRAAFDDWLLVEVNGTTIYVGPYEGDRLEIIENCISMDESGSCSYYSKKVQYAANKYGSPELNTSWDKTLSVNLKPYLRNGSNTIFMRTIVSGKGEGAIQITMRQMCPRECHDTWDDSQCATLRARAQ